MLKLENFELRAEGHAAAMRAIIDQQTALEATRLAGYDQGYQAGWEDAAAARVDEENQLAADLSRHLQCLSFTWHEARSHVLQSIEPVIAAILAQLLPALARESLGAIVLEMLTPSLTQAADTPAVLRLHPGARGTVEALLERATSLELQIEDAPELDEAQAVLRLGGQHSKIDLTRVIAQITEAVRGYFSLEQEAQDDGRAT